MIPNQRLAGWVCISALMLSSVLYGIFLYSEYRVMKRMPSMSDSEIRASLVVGMTTTDVEDILGDPVDKADHEEKEVWTYYNKSPENHPDSCTRIFVFFKSSRIESVDLK